MGVDTERETGLSRSRGFRFAFFPVPCWAVVQLSETRGYFGPSVSERFRMDAIMLQEKLVERLLCPRVRTARQKVKKVGFLGDKTGERYLDNLKIQ